MIFSQNPESNIPTQKPLGEESGLSFDPFRPGQGTEDVVGRYPSSPHIEEVDETLLPLGTAASPTITSANKEIMFSTSSPEMKGSRSGFPPKERSTRRN